MGPRDGYILWLHCQLKCGQVDLSAGWMILCSGQGRYYVAAGVVGGADEYAPLQPLARDRI